MSELERIARAAYAEQEKARQAVEEERAAERARREDAKDAKAIEMVAGSLLSEWFPGVMWELVGRGLPQNQVVVRDPSSDLHFLVGPNVGDPDEWRYSLIAEPGRDEHGYWRAFKFLVHQLTCPADVGQWLVKRDQEAAEVTP